MLMLGTHNDSFRCYRVLLLELELWIVDDREFHCPHPDYPSELQLVMVQRSKILVHGLSDGNASAPKPVPLLQLLVWDHKSAWILMSGSLQLRTASIPWNAINV